MADHIGIVACSAEGAALCYRTICTEAPQYLGEHNHPAVSVHTQPLIEYVRAIDADDWERVAELMLDSAERLAKIGAEFLICPDNTIHQAFAYAEQRSPLPWLHIAEPVIGAALARGFGHVGILGTRSLMESDVYPKRLSEAGLRYAVPSRAVRGEVDRIIMRELVYGVFKPASLEYLQRVIVELQDRGCDAALLGCTELPLVLNDRNSALPVLDSTRLLARAALRRAVT